MRHTERRVCALEHTPHVGRFFDSSNARVRATERARAATAGVEPHLHANRDDRFHARHGPKSLGYAVNGSADEAALAMLAHLLSDLPITMEITGTRMQAVELASLGGDRQFSVVCFADLPHLVVETRYLVRRLRGALPELRIAVGRWGPPALADESPQALLDAGANHVASLLTESRNYLGGLLELPRPPVRDTSDAAGLTALPSSIGGMSA